MEHHQDVATFDRWFINRICLTAALGGLLFGYDWVVIGGAKPFYEPHFGIDAAAASWWSGWAMSSALIGCLMGAFLSGWIVDRIGRRGTLLVAAIMFTLSSIATAISLTYVQFVTARIIGGIGIGLASNVSPIYISETAPAAMRGRLVSMNQLTIVFGILLAQMVNLTIYEMAPIADGATSIEILRSWNGMFGWRWMFAAEVIPATIFLVLAFRIPESPKWLISVGRVDEARSILSRVGGTSYAEDEIRYIQTMDERRDRGERPLRTLLTGKLRPILWLGIFVAVFQQWCGINVIFNYAEEIFAAAGYGVSGTMFNIVITGLVNLVATLVAVKTVDRWGRRPLMLAGAVGLAVAYAILGMCYRFELTGFPVLAVVICVIACYAMTLAPVTWVLISEIFPTRVRGPAVAIAVSCLWMACFLLTVSFQPINVALGAAGTFWLYSGICLTGFVIMLRVLPETNGRTLEQIEFDIIDVERDNENESNDIGR